jgi:type II restriction/modification system DNA methylase subunit YeeA
METKPLERFATQARRNLLAAVDAQATAVLSPGSVARSERAEVVKRLEDEIAAHSRPHVIDRVAYTWFNRIIALRFMDARGYTDAGVVSPAQGQGHGQPEILADAKRGNLDTDVVINKTSANAIIGLLEGTRQSTDAEGEAYALLLTDYCRYWHKSMPFMFEGEGDYTELLVPTGLLADGGILSSARDVLTEKVCDDVEVIGWLYQFYISERKQEVFDGFRAKGKARKPAGPDEIPAATQLFTPHWIVRYLVENSLGRLWMLSRPTSRLVEQMDYYIAPVDEEVDFLKITRPEELTVIDPACGSGHMLTYAFDLLYLIYEEEGYAPSEIPGLILTHNLHGTEIDPRAGSLAAFALTMKARAKQRMFFDKHIEPRICVIEPISFSPDELDILAVRSGDCHAEEAFWNQFEQADTLGALIDPDKLLLSGARRILETLEPRGDLLSGELVARAQKLLNQAEYLATRYSVVVANPPYMGSMNQTSHLAEWLTRHFPTGKADLFSSFMLRCFAFARERGQIGLMTPFVWMFISSYEPLRRLLLGQHTLTSLIQLEYSGFAGATVPICAFTVERGSRDAIGSFVRLANFVGPGQQGPRALEIIEDDNRRRTTGSPTARGMESHLYRVRLSELARVPGCPLAYWLSAEMLRVMERGSPVGQSSVPRQGLSTGDNERFLRLWFEVSKSRSNFESTSKEESQVSGARWFSINKGGDFRKWWGNQEYVVNWENNGSEIRSFGTEDGGKRRSALRNEETYFLRAITWGRITSGDPSFRVFPAGALYSNVGGSLFPRSDAELNDLLGILNSSSVMAILTATSPTLSFEVGAISAIPLPSKIPKLDCADLIENSKADWDAGETSWSFGGNPLVDNALSDPNPALASIADRHFKHACFIAERQRELEVLNNCRVAESYGLTGQVETDVSLSRVSLRQNPAFRYGPGLSLDEYERRFLRDAISDLISYAVGCMFGRYSVDLPGLILANQAAELRDYFARIPMPKFAPDVNNVIPFVDDGWFEDDIVERFRQFLRVAFGIEHFEANLRFVEESLGVKTLRDYFITMAGKSQFYDDHVQRYKNRPVYWMFSSPKGSFNALVYMHRYNPSTVSTMLNEYLREYRAKLEVGFANAERTAAGGVSALDQKEADRLRKVLAELRAYEHDVVYPLATRQIVIDLDDGVKVNYPKFYPALKKITGLEADDE